ncbi:IS110 family RNA-guided transposase [Acidithiobacillus ferriphilus]|uniref:IS110 family transposase n=1 Tax=Acidithiobacillus ferriphilus TaxID=1689834 RepID=UPI002DBE3DE3|nr:IS110 family transposase [Acidithiobacillus ferriphilus]MEB8536928.1 IS110 family transposase [Acidithiobacillus ferriphilus]
MTHPTLVLGIDVAKAKFDVALLNAEDKYRSKVFPNTPVGYRQFLEWLTRHDAREAHLCMETTGAYGRDLARFLAQQQFVSVVNPAQIHAFGKTELTRAKTDKADARLIARYCQMHRPAPWVPPAEEIVILQALVHRLEDLLTLQTMENNRLEATEGPARESVETVLAVIQQQIDKVRQQIQSHIDQHPHLKKQKELLSSIPGIGDNTAATLLAFLCPLDRFRSVKQVVAYAGLNPCIRQSGQWAGKTPIAKAGNALLRTALYLPAVVAKRHNPAIAAFCDRLLARGKRLCRWWSQPCVGSYIWPLVSSSPGGHSTPTLGLHSALQAGI